MSQTKTTTKPTTSERPGGDLAGWYEIAGRIVRRTLSQAGAIASGRLLLAHEEQPILDAEPTALSHATTPPAPTEAPESDPEPSPVELALGLMAANRKIAVKKIAKTVGCSTATLYRDPRFSEARRVLRETRINETEQSRRRIPRGEVSDGRLEAWKP